MDMLLFLRNIALWALLVTIIIVGSFAVFGWYHPADDDWAGFVSYLPSFFGTIFVVVLAPVAITYFIVRMYRNEQRQYSGPREFRVSKLEKGFKSKYRIKALAWWFPAQILGLSLDGWNSASGEPHDWLNTAGFLLLFVLIGGFFRTSCEGCQTSISNFFIGGKKNRYFGNLTESIKFIVSKRCTLCDVERY